jgi:hypothetical protein
MGQRGDRRVRRLQLQHLLDFEHALTALPLHGRATEPGFETILQGPGRHAACLFHLRQCKRPLENVRIDEAADDVDPVTGCCHIFGFHLRIEQCGCYPPVKKIVYTNKRGNFVIQSAHVDDAANMRECVEQASAPPQLQYQWLLPELAGMLGNTCHCGKTHFQFKPIKSAQNGAAQIAIGFTFYAGQQHRIFAWSASPMARCRPPESLTFVRSGVLGSAGKLMVFTATPAAMKAKR